MSDADAASESAFAKAGNCDYRSAMSTVQEIKQAVSALSREEREELVRWLSKDSTTYRQMTPEEHKRWCEELMQLREKTHFELGPVTWTRDDLYKR